MNDDGVENKEQNRPLQSPRPPPTGASARSTSMEFVTAPTASSGTTAAATMEEACPTDHHHQQRQKKNQNSTVHPPLLSQLLVLKHDDDDDQAAPAAIIMPESSKMNKSDTVYPATQQQKTCSNTTTMTTPGCGAVRTEPQESLDSLEQRISQKLLLRATSSHIGNVYDGKPAAIRSKDQTQRNHQLSGILPAVGIACSEEVAAVTTTTTTAIHGDNNDGVPTKLEAKATDFLPGMGIISPTTTAKEGDHQECGDNDQENRAKFPCLTLNRHQDDDEPSFDPLTELAALPQEPRSSSSQQPGAYASISPRGQFFNLASSTPTSHQNSGSTAITTTLTHHGVGDDEAGNSSTTTSLAQASLVSPLQEAQQVQQQQQAKEESKQHSSPTTTTCIIIGVMTLLVIISVTVAVVVCVVVVSHQENTEHSSQPITNPSRRDPEEVEAIQQEILEAFLGTLEDATSYSQALDWILEEDPLHLPSTADNLLQRFFLVYFYLSTTTEGPWNGCNPNNNNQTMSDLCYYDALMGDGLYDHAIATYTHWQTSYEEVLATRWLTGHHECQWAGLFCNDNQLVESMHLFNMNLTGSVPNGIAVALSDLQSLSLGSNSLHGKLPSSLANLHLQFLDLQWNQFTGTVPLEWWQSSKWVDNLRHINLAFSPLDSWTLPTHIGNMSNLEVLYLEHCSVTGSIPQELYQLSNLGWFILQGNSLTGTIATEVGLWSHLHMMALTDNLLTGTIPSQLGTLSTLSEVAFYGNAMSGTFPEELYNLRNIWAFIFRYNKFSGTISTDIGRLSTLGYLMLSGNADIVGTIPTELGLISTLRKMTLDGTGLSGTMPEQVCARRGTTYLYAIKADCAALSNGTAAPLSCPEECCTNCCNIETDECIKTGY